MASCVLLGFELFLAAIGSRVFIFSKLHHLQIIGGDGQKKERKKRTRDNLPKYNEEQKGKMRLG